MAHIGELLLNNLLSVLAFNLQVYQVAEMQHSSSTITTISQLDQICIRSILLSNTASTRNYTLQVSKARSNVTPQKVTASGRPKFFSLRRKFRFVSNPAAKKILKHDWRGEFEALMLLEAVGVKLMLHYQQPDSQSDIFIVLRIQREFRFRAKPKFKSWDYGHSATTYLMPLENPEEHSKGTFLSTAVSLHSILKITA